MNLYIDDYRRVAELQKRFSESFPMLKIEFYKEPHSSKERSADNCLVDGNAGLGEIRDQHNAGYLKISFRDAAGLVERGFRKKFGLNAQIFRKEGGSWVQTVATDSYTLKQHSDMAFHATRSLFPKFKEQCYDYGDL